MADDNTPDTEPENKPERPETLLDIPAGDLDLTDAQSGETLLSLDGAESVLSRVDASRGSALSGQALELKGSEDETRRGTTPTGSFTERIKHDTGGIKYAAYNELGRGGMGVVLGVRDNDLRRRVAMKVVRSDRVKPGTKTGDMALQRFVEEAQITGQLEHPNIVPVHELGADAKGRVYFTMKLVHGRPLNEIIRELRRGDEATGREFSLDRLLNIFMKVCDAIAFAHSHNVVHRDLKPENIMIGRFGEVLVMDWGLARILDRDEPGLPERADGIETDSRVRKVETGERQGSALSMEGTIAGTPAYMAPEQARGEVSRIDQRTDIFALGAILYEILVLRPPYTAEGATAIIEQAARGLLIDPFERIAGDEQLRERLSRLPGGRIPRELAAIAMHALAANRDHRYPTAQALKEDVENYLAGRPVSVHRDPLTVRMAKWVRRHPTLSMSSGAAAAVLLISVASIMFIVAQARQEAIRQQGEIVAASREAEQQAGKRAQAEAELKEAALRRERALETRAEATAAYRRGAEQFDRATAMIDPEVRRQAREKAADSLAAAMERDGEYFDPVFALARLMHLFGEESALEYYDRANSVVVSGTGRGDARALVYAGDFAREVAGDLELAERYYRRASEVDPEDPHALVGRGWIAILHGEFEQARDFAVQARGKSEALWEPWYLEGCVLGSELTPDGRAFNPIYDPVRAEALLTEAQARNNREGGIFSERGAVRINLGNMKAAEADLRRAIELAPGSPVPKLNLTIALRKQGKSKEALAITTELVSKNEDFYQVWSNHGMSLLHEGRADEALEALEKSLELRSDRPVAHNNMAFILISLGRHDEARAQAEKALEIEPRMVSSWLLISTIHEDAGEYAEALSAVNQALAIRQDDHIALARKARVLLRQDNVSEAREVIERAYEIAPADSNVMKTFAAILQAQQEYRRAIEIYETVLESTPDDWEAQLNLATSLHLTSKLLRALYHAERAVKLRPGDSATQFRYGTLLLHLGRSTEALPYFREATELDPAYIDAWVNRASAANGAGELEEARDASKQVVEHQPGNVLGWVNLGRAELALGNVDAAGRAADQANSVEAPDARTKSMAADLCYQLGRYDEAWKAAQAALSMDSTDADAWRAMARGLYGVGRLHESLQAANKLVEMRPQDINALNLVATLHLELGQYREADAAARRALEADPASAMAYTTLADARSRQGQHLRAIDAYEAALRIDSSVATTWLNLGVSWLILGDYDRSIPPFKTATGLDETLAPAWEYWGTALQAQGRSTEAKPKLEKAVELTPNSAGAHSNLANAHYSLGELEDAIEHADKAVKLNPRNASGWYRKGMSHFDLGQWAPAAAAFEQVAALAPQNQFMPYMVARCKAELGEYEEAKSWGEKALALDAGLHAVKVVMAWAEIGLGNTKAALKQLREALDDGADPAWALGLRCWDEIRETEEFQAIRQQYES